MSCPSADCPRRSLCGWTPPPPEAVSRTRNSARFRRIQTLHDGNANRVTRAWDTDLQRWIVLKRAKPNCSWATECLERELQTLLAISHPGVPKVILPDKVSANRLFERRAEETVQPKTSPPSKRDVIGLSMFHGWTLRQRFAWGLDASRAVAILTRVAMIVGDVHRLGVMHLDLKPENILVNDKDEPHVIDWGSSGEIRSADFDAPITATRVVGTPFYMPPEQALGMRCDASSDVFALGSVLCEAVTGTPAYRPEESFAAAAAAKLDDAWARLDASNVRTEVIQVIQRCLQIRRRDRFPDAREFARTLARCPP